MNSWMTTKLIMFLCLGVYFGITHAGVYKCSNTDGKTVYSEKPCSENAQEFKIKNDTASILSDEERAAIKEKVERDIFVTGKRLKLQKIAETDQQLKSFLDSIKIWMDSYHAAESTPRMALSNMIITLSEQKNKILFLPVSTCYETSKKILITGFEEYIESLSKFMANRNDSGNVESSLHREFGDQKMSEFWKSIPESCQ